jgi:DNA invertase Pin-like site-specific DNA recombinase
MEETFGYARTSKTDQCEDRQIDALIKYGVSEDKIFLEKITGTKKHRPQLDALRSQLRKGDTVVVESLSRLGRSTKNLLELLNEFEEKGVTLISLKENIDMTTATGKLLITVLSAISQFERDIIVQRTNEGLSSARARGRQGGRPKINEKKMEQAYQLYLTKSCSIKDICNTYGISQGTLYNYINKKINSYKIHCLYI